MVSLQSVWAARELIFGAHKSLLSEACFLRQFLMKRASCSNSHAVTQSLRTPSYATRSHRSLNVGIDAGLGVSDSIIVNCH